MLRVILQLESCGRKQFAKHFPKGHVFSLGKIFSVQGLQVAESV
jgi:hypothetical protein